MKDTQWRPNAVVLDGCDTLAKLFRKKCHERGSEIVALREKDLGIWRDYSWAEYYEGARQVGSALIALGLAKGDRIGILSDDNKEWVFCDLGAQCAGIWSVGFYPTLQTNQLSYQVSDCEAKLLIVENEEQLDKFLLSENDMPLLETVVVLDNEGLRGFSHPKVLMWDDFIAKGDSPAGELSKEWESRIDASKPDDIAIAIYTSGTTGKPKGTLLSHRYLMRHGDLHPELPYGPGDEILTFLPLCHGAERYFSVVIPICHGITINFAENMETFNQDIQEVSPTIVFAVPRIWEKMYSSVDISMREATKFGRWAYSQALKVGEKRASYQNANKSAPIGLRLLHWCADRLVLRNIRVHLGLNRAHGILSGAAPVSANLLAWFSAMGLKVYEAYGQTEAGICTCTVPGLSPLGSVGRALRGAEIKIAEDGEILLRSASNFSAYLNQPEKTAETFSDGWILTGDVGRLDENGDLFILDRKKDIIITAGGKNITPSQIENELKFSPYISDAVVIGDRRKFLTALIMIDQDNVANLAQERRIPFSDYKSLCAHPDINEVIAAEIDTANAQLAPVEQIKKFRLIDVLLTPEDEELTPTMKLKRKEVERKYRDLIGSMY